MRESWNEPATDPAGNHLRVVPANRSGAAELDLVFGERGAAAMCRCQRYKLQLGESFGGDSAAARTDRLHAQTACGQPKSPTTSGLVGYLGDEPVGWCAVEPRVDYVGLVRVFRVPWEGREEDRADASVWALTCLLTRAGFRKRGVSRAMVAAAVDFARDRGARAIEGYPIATGVVSGNVPGHELHVGTEGEFSDAGFLVVSRPGRRRVVMRIDF